jgi:hypothetical protein
MLGTLDLIFLHSDGVCVPTLPRLWVGEVRAVCTSCMCMLMCDKCRAICEGGTVLRFGTKLMRRKNGAAESY